MAVILYIILYRYLYIILFRYRAPGVCKRQQSLLLHAAVHAGLQGVKADWLLCYVPQEVNADWHCGKSGALWGVVVPKRCPLPRRWSLGSGGPLAARLWRETNGQQSRATIPSPPCRGSGYFRLMWTWMNQRRWSTRCSRLRFMISSGGAPSFWP